MLAACQVTDRFTDEPGPQVVQPDVNQRLLDMDDGHVRFHYKNYRVDPSSRSTTSGSSRMATA